MSTPTPNPPVSEIAEKVARIVSDARNLDVRLNNGVMIENVVATKDGELVVFLSNGASLKATLTPFARATKNVG